jgi:AcrR family transcriptional regulator
MKTVIKRASGIIRRKQIKKATLEIISSDGLKQLSTKNLAHQVHLSEGTIFRHFHSKEEIMLSILEDVKTELLNPLQKIVQKTNSPAEKLKEFMCFHLNYLEKHNGVTILLFTETAWLNGEILKNEFNRFFRTIKQYFEKIIYEGIYSKQWETGLPVDAISSLYMGIPAAISIEIKLRSGNFPGSDFCFRMFTLVSRLLEQQIKTINAKKPQIFES